jgi:hypothetical protein
VSGVSLTCAQCGRVAPVDPAQLAGWRSGGLDVPDDIDDTAAGIVLCPDCDADHRLGEYEPGGDE